MVDRWIKASQQKPEEGKVVLVYTPGFMGAGWLRNGEWIACGSFAKLSVSFWRDMPAPPKSRRV